MTSVVFTGKGYRNGSLVTRAEWEAMAREIGWEPHGTVVWGTDYLVASRGDTTKAQRAANFGTRVMTYEWFLQRVADRREHGSQNRTSMVNDPMRVVRGMTDLGTVGRFRVYYHEHANIQGRYKAVEITDTGVYRILSSFASETAARGYLQALHARETEGMLEAAPQEEGGDDEVDGYTPTELSALTKQVANFGDWWVRLNRDASLRFQVYERVLGPNGAFSYHLRQGFADERAARAFAAEKHQGVQPVAKPPAPADALAPKRRLEL